MLLSRPLQKTYGRLTQAVNDSLRYTALSIDTIGAFGVIGMPAYWVVWKLVFPQEYENLTLRLVGSLICLPLWLVNRWPEKWKPYLPVYWSIAVVYNLPFFFTFMFLKASEASFLADVPSFVWPMSSVIALVLMVLIVTNGFVIGLQYIVGTILAWLGFLLAREPGAPIEPVLFDYFGYLPVFLFILIGGSLYNHRKETTQQEMLRAVSSVGSSIAHELRTPLLGIRANAKGLINYLPNLLEAYDLARKEGLPVKPIRAIHLKNMQSALQRIESEIMYSNTIIDMLLMNSSSTRVVPSEFARCSMRECVETALQRYPFATEEERQKVCSKDLKDFTFVGSDILMMHVLFNLLKNALYYIREAGKGDIRIWTDFSRAPQQHMLHFRDSGAGIPPDAVPLVFDRFYSRQKTGRGSGIGLSFCKLVMDGFGGSIKCYSEHQEFTEFVLVFPGVDDDG